MDLVGHIPVSNLPMSETFQLIQLTAEHVMNWNTFYASNAWNLQTLMFLLMNYDQKQYVAKQG